MRNPSKLSLTAAVLALSAAAFAPLTSAVAADMPAAPPQMQGEVQPPPPAYYPPQVEPGYPPPPVAYAPPPPPPAVYYADIQPPYGVWPGAYYYGPGWGGYGPRRAYGHWGHGHR